MIFRKPYAFLIKNFRKIHIAILAAWLFIYFKVNDITSFVSEFIGFGTYSSSLESFSSKVGILFYLVVIFIIVSSLLLLILLKRKDKPWKVYLIYIFEYVLLLFAVIFLSGFFSSYTINTNVSGVLIYRDMLNISKYLQYVVLVFLVIRVLGIDLKKFNFKNDEEFLELSSDDREEFEISFDFDKNSIKRGFNRFKRNFNYFYREHKFICDIFMIGCFVFLIGYSYYYFGIVHKSYKQGKTFNSGIYSITVNDSYVTNKDYAGNSIEKGYKFVIVKVSIKNNYNKTVEPNLDRFHLVNKNTERSYSSFYNSYFKDLGDGADDAIKINTGKEKYVYLVYRVKGDLDNKKFVLYYQELGGKLRSYLRKIKLNIQDVSEIKDVGEYNKGDKIDFSYVSGTKKKITITDSAIQSSFAYHRYYCPTSSMCGVYDENLTAEEGKLLLKISFASSDFEGEDFIDFSSSYGKIKYIDNKGKTQYASIKNAIKTNYQGKEIFISSDADVLNSEKIWIEYILRNKRYVLRIK